VGKELPLSGVDWSKNERTLILALSSTCRFCTMSAPFYQRLASERKNVRLIAVLPQPEAESQKYLSDLGVSVDEVRRVSMRSLGVRGTPTLILVDGAGVVTGEWRGKLAENQEHEVLSRLTQ
jgi:thioredoxin-related protein